jgi:hypothetical protein
MSGRTDHRDPFLRYSGADRRSSDVQSSVLSAGEDIAAAREEAIRVIEKLHGLRLSRAAELVEMAVEEPLAYYAFPEEDWRRIRTSRASCARSAGAGASWAPFLTLNRRSISPPRGLRHIASTAWSTKVRKILDTPGGECRA